MSTSIQHYRPQFLHQAATDASVVYSVSVQKMSRTAPAWRKYLSHALTATLLLASIVGFYQLGTILSAEFGASAPAHSSSPTNIRTTPAAAVPPAPTKPASSSVLARSIPTRLEIPAIHVDTAFSVVGQKEDGSIDVPPHDLVGWYTGSPTPGELGPSVVVGHVDSVTGPAVFWDLENLQPGDSIRITREDGQIATFEVQKLETYAQDAFPSATVYGNLDYSGLRLITCDGDFNYATRHYSHNLVVYAKLKV